jgi:hypothetical protein
MSDDAKRVEPEHQKSSFSCPHCGAIAHQSWDIVTYFRRLQPSNKVTAVAGLSVATCFNCKKFSLWLDASLIYPNELTAPRAHSKLPKSMQKDFEEARSIANLSPRGAAALLRLVIQKLCKHLGQPGKNLNDDIGALVTLGLPQGAQQALDVVRVTGNNAVHPGELDVNDSPQLVIKLFKLVNLIVEKMIAEPEELKALFEALPERAKKQIEDRDRGATDET